VYQYAQVDHWCTWGHCRCLHELLEACRATQKPHWRRDRIDLFLVLRSQMCLPTFNSRFSWVNSNDPQFLMKLTNHPGRYCKAKQNLPNDHGQNDQNHGKKTYKEHLTTSCSVSQWKIEQKSDYQHSGKNSHNIYDPLQHQLANQAKSIVKNPQKGKWTKT